jgi:energy-coupling factor transport system ATP-binding protein
MAGALAENPKLLLLDELTTFLDREDQFGVLHAVRSIASAKSDVTAVWVTHR